MVIVTTLSEEKSVTSLLNAAWDLNVPQSAGGKKKPVILADSGQ